MDILLSLLESIIVMWSLMMQKLDNPRALVSYNIVRALGVYIQPSATETRRHPL